MTPAEAVTFAGRSQVSAGPLPISSC